MTTYSNGTAIKATPDGHSIHPDCGAPVHGYANAHRYRGCTCPGPSYTAFLARRRRSITEKAAAREKARLERQAEAARVAAAPPGHLVQLTAQEAARPQRRAAFVEAGAAEREFRKRDDKACINADPDVFEVTGTGKAADRQLAEAQQWCNVCPARAACLAAALERGEQWTVAAGYSPAQLEQMRRQQVAA